MAMAIHATDMLSASDHRKILRCTAIARTVATTIERYDFYRYFIVTGVVLAVSTFRSQIR